METYYYDAPTTDDESYIGVLSAANNNNGLDENKNEVGDDIEEVTTNEDQLRWKKIYNELDTFEAQLQDELQDLETAHGIPVDDSNSMKATTKSNRGYRKQKRKDRRGRSNKQHQNSNSSLKYLPSTYTVSSKFSKGNGKSGKKLIKLTHKTSELKDDYQRYLASLNLSQKSSNDMYNEEEEKEAANVYDHVPSSPNNVLPTSTNQQQHLQREWNYYDQEEALPSKEDDDISSIVVPTTSSSLASTKNVAVETCKTKETNTPQQEYDDAILMLKSRAKQRQEDTPTACQTRPPPARWPPKEEDQITLKYSITRESNEKGEDDSFLSSSSAPSELDSLPAVYMNDEHDMRSTSTNTSSKFHRDIGQFSTVVSVNSMSAIYSQDEDKMVEREASTKDITKRDINTLNDFDSIAAESELTEDTVFDTRLDVLPTVDETKSIASAQQLGPTNDKKFDSSRHGTTTQDCNYNTTLDTAYEEFGVERQLAIIDENGRKARQGMKLRLIKPRNFGLPWKPNKPVDVDETSFATSLADNSVKSTYSNNSGDDEEVGQLDWLCGDMCGNEDDIVNDEYTTAGFTIATQGRSIMTTSSKPKPKPKDNKFDKIMDVMEYVLTGYKACETEFDCQTEYDGKTVDTGLGLDDETNVHSQKSRNENINGVVNIDAIRMQGMIFESPTDDKSKANVDLFEC